MRFLKPDLKPEKRERLVQFVGRIGARWKNRGDEVAEVEAESDEHASTPERFNRVALFGRIERVVSRMFRKELPPLAITKTKPSTLLILMAGTTVRQYEDAGQLGRLTSSLERYSKHFRSVVLMTTDGTGYTEQISLSGVKHVRVSLPVPLRGSALLLASAILRFRSVRKATAVLLMDEEAALTGWLASRLSGASLSMSVGAPWCPPREVDVDGLRKWAIRKSLSHVTSVVEWPGAESLPATPNAEFTRLPEMVDVDLYCPITTTDPARPRTVGVFIGPDHEASARVIVGVTERLKRRKHNLVVRVFVVGESSEARAAALQGEASERDIAVEFLPLPPVEMLPDAIARMRLCVAFGEGGPVQLLLRSMASGVPGIAVRSQGDKSSESEKSAPDWTIFVLNSSATEEEITRNIETLFREPGVRLRLAREGRRFVVAKHSLEALATQETMLLLGQEELSALKEIEDEFDSAAEAEKLAMMLEAVGVRRIDEVEPEDLTEEQIAA